ncbi:MAG TPA: hypothetical protein VK814_18740 [Acidobacteriaceae bacterium]|jgi:hypothetical protein|nr:hypothetical protein [Acidobacteriaceae bacterium]
MSREAKSVGIAVTLSGLVTVASTVPLWRDLGEGWGVLLLLSLPGAIFAFPLGAMGVVGNAHDPSLAVIASVDFLFYAWLFSWLMMRRRRHEN